MTPRPRRALYFHHRRRGTFRIRGAYMNRNWSTWIVTDARGDRHEFAFSDCAAIRFVDWPDTELVA